MFSISGKNSNIRPACSALNISYLDCYRSPSSKVLNISTLPCIHHVLYLLRVLYVSIQRGNIQVTPFLKKTCKRHWAQDQNITFLSMVLSPCLSQLQSPLYQLTHHYFSSKWIYVLIPRKPLQLFSLSGLPCLLSLPGERWSFPSFKINIQNLFICDTFFHPLITHLTYSQIHFLITPWTSTIEVTILHFNNYYAGICLSSIENISTPEARFRF